MVSRIRNSIRHALNTVVTPLPKMIVIVLENDVIQELVEEEFPGMAYNRSINWLANEIRKMIAAHNDLLPKKAKRKVNIVWVLPSEHAAYADMSSRQDFAARMKIILKLFDGHHALALRQMWDTKNPNLYLKEQQRFTIEGLNSFWKAVDRTIWFADMIIYKAGEKEVRRFYLWDTKEILAPLSHALEPPPQHYDATYRPPSRPYRRPRGYFRSYSRRPSFRRPFGGRNYRLDVHERLGPRPETTSSSENTD